MCGISGIFAYGDRAQAPCLNELRKINAQMFSRGPDGGGEWAARDKSIILGHRRLSILDLSERASQPMTTADGKLSVTFNGEIYNYQELRSELEAKSYKFSTTSDTETLLYLYREEGPNMLHKLRGMFAFAIWDNEANTLFIARDPLGIKPLYISDDGETLRFASQVKALIAGGRISSEIDEAGLVGFCLFGHVPEPFTIYRSIRSLAAGHYEIWTRGKKEGQSVKYASAAQVLSMSVGAKNAEKGIIEDYIRQSVAAHLVSDVDVGVFLSAGIDAGALLGVASELSARPLKAITLGFEEFKNTPQDEAPLAQEISKFYNVDHKVRFVTPDEFHDDLPKILSTMDQPTIDGVNSWFVSKAAHESGIKVCLSGLGGDELVGGYRSFKDIPRWVTSFQGFKYFPQFAKNMRRLGLGLFPKIAQNNPKLFGLIEYASTIEGAYLTRRGLFMPYEIPQILGVERTSAGLERLNPLKLIKNSLSPDPQGWFRRISALEISLYMRNQLLRDADWAGMAHSVEIRTPLVDFTLLTQLSPFGEILSKKGKEILSHAPRRALPEKVRSRKKTGFGVPTDAWMQVGLSRERLKSRLWAREILKNYDVAGNL